MFAKKKIKIKISKLEHLSLNNFFFSKKKKKITRQKKKRTSRFPACKPLINRLIETLRLLLRWEDESKTAFQIIDYQTLHLVSKRFLGQRSNSKVFHEISQHQCQNFNPLSLSKFTLVGHRTFDTNTKLAAIEHINVKTIASLYTIMQVGIIGCIHLLWQQK